MAVVYNPDGKRRQYGYVWSKVRAIILDRDAHFHDGKRTCELCGAVEGDRVYDERGRAVWCKDKQTGKRRRVFVFIEIDHIVPFVLGGGEFDIDNLISLCRRCNRKSGDSRKDPAIEAYLLGLSADRNRAVLEGGEA